MQKHSWSQIFTGETITLRCEIQGGEGAQWTYEWRAAKLNTPPTSNEYRIIRATESDSGGYSCRGRRDYFFSEWSDIITLTVSSSKPRATLTAQSSVIPAGGSVTLSCSVEGSAGWKFDWFRRDSVSSKAQLMRGNKGKTVIHVSQGGLYHCRGGRGDPAFYTEDSSDVTVVETFPNKPTVILKPSWPQIYSGETVTVRCEGSQSLVVWREHKLITPSTSEYRISRATESDSGGYSCCTMSLSVCSDIITLTVSCNKPRATLTAHSSILPAGGSVTLSCSVEGSAGWKFDWLRRDSVSSKAQLMRGNEANRVISVSQEGLYHCRGGRGNPVYYTEDSSDVTVKETLYWCESGSGEFSSAVNITVQNGGNGPILVSPVHPVTEGASVNLSCSLKTQKILSNVFFYHNDKLLQNDTRGELKISAVSKSDEGFYKCQYSGRESPQSWMSVKVTVSGADSSSSPVWLIVGLVCGVSLTIILLLLLYCCRTTNSDHCGYEIIRRSENIEKGCGGSILNREAKATSSSLSGGTPRLSHTSREI
ncbi:high affinity immunoglobulin gamma Fc receptor I-like [Neolamprologus brichardi]|uniref:high affinity immunoglobulin gamma Fc receptor I-like n=1 Tax=Neolamprologus brichardi TaxID=32507 RepID=UPI001643DBBA|nr:high affinity immunoglobulin gamma Fc receptor I-like [Neolamprologus brichardi]